MLAAFFRSFRRNADGSWTCVAPATLIHPRGSIFMGVDVAAWLESQAAEAGGLRSSQSVSP